MKCPKCRNHILPFKVWLISTWSFIACKKCGTKSGRNINLQLFLILALLVIPIVLKFNVFSLVFFIWAIVVMFLDAYTIKLIPQNNKGR